MVDATQAGYVLTAHGEGLGLCISALEPSTTQNL